MIRKHDGIVNIPMIYQVAALTRGSTPHLGPRQRAFCTLAPVRLVDVAHIMPCSPSILMTVTGRTWRQLLEIPPGAQVICEHISNAWRNATISRTARSAMGSLAGIKQVEPRSLWQLKVRIYCHAQDPTD